MPFESLILNKAFEEGFTFLKTTLKNNHVKITLKKQDLHDAISHHQKLINNITRTVSFKEMLAPKAINKIYIDLDIHLSQRKLLPFNSKQTPKTINEIINLEYHLIILGDPGAGKTTTLKNLTQKILHDSAFLKEYNFPILIELREFEENDTLFKRLSKILGISIFFSDTRILNFKDQLDENFFIGAMCQYLDSLKILLLIDGLDELNEEKQKSVIKEVRVLFNSLNSSKALLTCRSGAFYSNIENSVVYEICQLNNVQINNFLKRWFGDVKLEKEFRDEITKPAFKDFSFRPLTLSHLCALFEKHKRLPEKPKYIYKKLIYLLLEDWDIERNITRPSKYYNFETDRKYEFLTNLAYELTIFTDKKRFSEEELILCLKKFSSAFGLSSSELMSAINEIESQNGIFVKSSFNSYEFSHKSMQEYLTADYIVRKGSIPYELLSKENLPNEIAIAVSLSSSPPNEYFYKILYGVYLRIHPSAKMISEFLKRLSIEKPDFTRSAFLAFTIYHIYNVFYFDEAAFNSTTITKQEKVERIIFAEKNFNELFSNLITIPGVADSFKLLNKIILFDSTTFENVFFVDTKNIKSLEENLINEVATYPLPDYLLITKKLRLQFVKE